MSRFRGKISDYVAARIEGLPPYEAGIHAGYAQAGIRVAICRLEQRADVRKAIKAGAEPQAKGGVEDEPDVPADDGGREQWAMKDSYESPLDLMLDVMNNALAPKTLRYQAAKDALPYCHPRKEGGKKEDRAKEAKKAAQGKFRPGRRPGQRQHTVQ
jgi:hypothetical protein